MRVRPLSAVAECGSGPRDIAPEPGVPGKAKRFSTARLEKRAVLARQSWPEFWRDLGMRFLVAGAVVLVVLLVLWLLGFFVR